MLGAPQPRQAYALVAERRHALLDRAAGVRVRDEETSLRAGRSEGL
ncbi:hypothetical protein ACLQ28_20855 [Micromonospora sp. DT201]